jgi:hypothetical protein
MDTIKQVVSDVTGSAKSATETGQSGTFPGPDEFKVHSQRDEGKEVGIQAEMGNAPQTTDQESHYGFDTYKPAGKLVGKK